uniref:Exostosin GT47 domain-containing protein n=1 Tax=Kalanchoe fedtschenkoi TaxID=63787 RepID=A0A7N1A345_KALFE
MTAEKHHHSNPPPIALLSRKPLFYLFSVTSTLFILSWFFVLQSTGRPLDQTILIPSSKIFNFINGNYDNADNNAILKQQHEQKQEPVFPTDHKQPEDEEQEETTTAAATATTTEENTEDGVNAEVDCNCKRNQILKVFMYDLPSEFHFQLLGWTPEKGGDSVWPDLKSKKIHYPGGLNLQHSIEYWLTLDLLASQFDDSSTFRSAKRVLNSSEADVIFVPFFSSLSYNRFSKARQHEKKGKDRVLQERLVKYLTSQAEWKRSGGRDHIVMAHHPNSLLHARMKLWPATFILSDFGRYPPNIANVEKDIIAPYKHMIKNYYNDSSSFESRKTLLYFQGAIYRKDGGVVRQELFYLLKDEKGVHFSFGSVQKDGIKAATTGMHNSKFCLNIAGDTPSSNRLFDAIASHCVPVIISDHIELPYEDVLDYTQFCIFVKTSDAIKKHFLINLIRSITKAEWTRMWNRLQEVEIFYEYNYPTVENDAVQMIWQAASRKVPNVKLKLHRSRRYFRTGAGKEKGLRSAPLPKNFG